MKRNISGMMAFVVMVTLACTPSLYGWQETQNDEQVIKVFALANTDATDVATILNEITAEGSGISARIVADATTNSLLVAGDPASVIQVEDLVERLDVAPIEPKEKNVFKAFGLGNGDPMLTHRILQSLMGDSSNIRMQVDEVKKELYVLATAETITMVEDLLARIDANRASRQPTSVFVSLTLVVESEQVGDEQRLALDEPTAEIQTLLGEAEDRGLFSFRNPAIVTSMVTSVPCGASPAGSGNTRPGSRDHFDFESTSSEVASGYTVTQRGSLWLKDHGNLHLETDIQIDIDPAGRTGAGRSHSLKTGVVAPFDHPVVLTFSSINGVDTAVILKFLPEQ